MSKVSYNLSKNSVVVNYDGQTRIFTSDDAKYDKVKDFIKADNMEGLADFLVSFKQKVERAYSGFRVDDDVVYIDGESIPALLGERLMVFHDEGLNYKYLLNFWRRLRNNPSRTAVHELFACLERNHHPILPDGRFMGWKAVRSTFKDKHSNTFDNSVGNIVSIPRREVDDNNRNECSYGLHVASYGYARNTFAGAGDVVVEVAVDPADVVAVPVDYNFMKMRTCKYEVLAVSKDVRDEQVVSEYPTTSWDDDEDEDDYEDGDDWDDDDDDDYEDDEECHCSECQVDCDDDDGDEPYRSAGSPALPVKPQNYRHNKRGPGGQFAKK